MAARHWLVPFHAQGKFCVRISIKDLNGKYGVYLDAVRQPRNPNRG